jgi:LPS-assembly lipoprotein
MWWREAGAGFALLTLAACGFQPLHRPAAQTVDPGLAAVRVNPIPERLGQRLANELRDSFNPASLRVETTHSLHVSLTTSRREVAIRRDASVSRLEFEVAASWQLEDLATRQRVAGGVARSIDAFDLVENEYANVVASQDAQARTLRDIAHEIRTRVALYLSR